MATVTDGSHQVHTVDAVVDVFIFTQVVHAVHQGLTHHDVTKGDDVGDDRSRNRVQEDVQVRETHAERQVVRQLVKGRLGDAPLYVGDFILSNVNAHQDGHHHARHHAVVGNLAGNAARIDKTFERNGEHKVQAHQATHRQGDRCVGQPAAGFDFTQQRGNTDTDDDTALHGPGNPLHQLAAQAGNTQNQENQEHQELQGKERLDGLGAGLVV